MIYQKFTPPPILAGYVRSFWILEGNADHTETTTHRLVADGCPGLIFNYGNPFRICQSGQPGATLPNCHIAGQTSQYREMMVTGKFGVLGVYFYPLSTQLFFKMPALELTNGMIEAESVLGKEAYELEEKVLAAPNNFYRIKVISEFLIKKIKDMHQTEIDLHVCVRQILRTRGTTPVEQIGQLVGVSNRHFERKFINHTGLSPKLFSRIAQFQSTLRNAQAIGNLTDLAFMSGYYDQSHFIRNFKAFSGLSPRYYFKGIPDVADGFFQIPNHK